MRKRTRMDASVKKVQEEENFERVQVRKINTEDKQVALVINMSLTTYKYKRTLSMAFYSLWHPEIRL